MSLQNELEFIFTEEIYSLPPPVLIILSKPWEDLTEDELNTLSRMLQAVKLTLASVQVLIKKEFSVDEFSVLSPKRILAFGSVFKSSSTMYETLSIGETSIIVSESLDKLDDAKKKSLWIALKIMFTL